jgi:uncharacterized protein (DUF697 family)
VGTVRLRDRIGIDERRQRQLVRAMEFVLVGLLFVALDHRNVGGVVTAAVALGVTKLPSVLERDYRLELDAGLTLWLTTAVFLHTIGVVVLPGTEIVLYNEIPGYDHVTHALSASVVAGVGYATVRAFDDHSDEVDLPRRFTFVFVLLFVLAFGVGWEILEFTIGEVTEALGIAVSGATQHGLEDTMMDIVFNTVGGVVVAAWGHAHLSDVVGELQRRMD